MTAAGIVENQQRTFARLWRGLAPHLRTDRDLPARIQRALGSRAFGGRDRRLYRELHYTALRHWPWIDELAARGETEALRAVAWLAAETPATRPLRTALLAGWPAPPPSVADRARLLGTRRGLLPEWFRPHCPEAFTSPNLEALASRAPLWIRLQTDAPEAVAAEFARRGWPWSASAEWPEAWRIDADADLTATAAHRTGRFEIQDLGSQLVLASVGIPAGGRWLDACAGAGGKTLQLARLLGARGRVDAHDIRRSALAELRNRAGRAGLENIRILEPETAGRDYDGVLVDAPCTGSGTWRRSPHLKWSTRPEDPAAYARRQLALLEDFSPRVRPGGLLVYATCSLSRRENQDVVAGFVQGRPGFSVEAPARAFRAGAGEMGLTILPALHDSDGFFVATLRRTA